MSGSIADLLDAATLLVEGAELRSTPPDASSFIELLTELGAEHP